MSDIVEVLELRPLRELRGVDCNVSKCYANAYGTGRLVRMGHRSRYPWCLETRCPDCGTVSYTASRRTQALARDVLAADEPGRDAIARRWVAQCPRVHPCR